MRYIVVVLGVVLVSVFFKHYLSSVKPSPDVIRQIHYRFLVYNQTNSALHDARVPLFAPVPSNAHQETISVEASRQFTIQDDEIGNREVVVTMLLPPRSTTALSVTASVGLRRAPISEALVSGDIYLRNQPGIDVNHPEIKALATNLKRNTTIETARSIYEWVHQNIRDTGFTKEDRGALFALKEKQGDCTEFSNLFVALARANGVPSRPLAGFVVEQDSVLKPFNYHNWSEFYDGRYWRIVDANKGVFDSGYDRYVTFKILGASSGSEGLGQNNAGILVEMD